MSFTLRFARCLAMVVGLAALAIMPDLGLAGVDSVEPVETFQSSPATYADSVLDGMAVVYRSLEDLKGQASPEQLKWLSGWRETYTPHAVAGTVRFRFAISVGGTRPRIEISNLSGARPLDIGAASIAIAMDGMDAMPGTLRRLTFQGRASVVIPADGRVSSDPVDTRLAPFSELLASLYLAEPASFIGLGGATMALAPGDATLDDRLPQAVPLSGRPLVTAVVLLPDRPTRVLVALGDSITDGNRPVPWIPHGWADLLARRLAAARVPAPVAVVTAAISGNRVLRAGWGPSALDRLERDVLDVPGVRCILLLEGINDIGDSGSTLFGTQPGLSAEQLISGYRQIVARAHRRGIKIIGATLLPFRGATYFSEDKEKIRRAVNNWIRGPGSFDGIVDFDAAMRDPGTPDRLRNILDSGDHLHPNDIGYAVMAKAVPLSLFLGSDALARVPTSGK